MAVYFGLSSAVNEARRLFSQWMSGNLLLPPDIRDIVYSTGIFFFIDFDFSLVSSFQTHSTLFAGIKYGGWTEWDYCWQRYKETTVPDERLNFLRALAASNDPWILQQ